MKNVSIFIIVVLLLSGCVYVAGTKNKAYWIATIERGGPGKSTPVRTQAGTFYLELDRSIRFLHGIEYEYRSILVGNGPTFLDPDLEEYGHSEMARNRGTITVDKTEMKVIIDLKRIVSKPGAPERVEPNPANGTYPIKRWVD